MLQPISLRMTKFPKQLSEVEVDLLRVQALSAQHTIAEEQD